MSEKETIIIGSDHAGFRLKEGVKEELKKVGLDWKDIGTHTDSTPSDYPDFAAKVAASVSSGIFKRGILVCGNGMGMSVVANRYPRVRAVICTTVGMAISARRELDSNILVLGGDFVHGLDMHEILKTWLNTMFEGGEHLRRVQLIDDNLHLNIALGHLAEINPKKIELARINKPFMQRALKGFEKVISSLAPSNRREDTDDRQTESCRATLEYEGQTYEGIMMDLSSHGAQFQLAKASGKPTFIRDDPLSMTIKTTFGTGTYAGKIRWFDPSELHVGVSWDKLPENEDDPLRALLDSSL